MLKKNKAEALKYYQQALEHCRKKQYSWINAVRHNVVALTADQNEKWANLWQLYIAKDLKESEFLTFARLSVIHGKKAEALELYNKCPNASLTRDDLFTLVELNTSRAKKMEAFRQLADRLEKEIKHNDKEVIEKFCALGSKLSADEVIYDLLRRAVVKGNTVAPELYISFARKLKKLDADAVSILIQNKKLDKQVIELAVQANNEALFISEAKRWAQNKYANYQQYLVKAGMLLFNQKQYSKAWELWSILELKELDPIWDKCFKVLDKQTFLTEKDLEFLATRSLMHNDLTHLAKLAQAFENKNEYDRAVFFWSKVLGNTTDNGKVHFKLFICTDPARKIAKHTVGYDFDREAIRVYNELKKVQNRKENLFKAAFSYCNKEAVFYLGNLWYTRTTNEFYPTDAEEELKKTLRKLRATSKLTPEEAEKVEKYIKAQNDVF